MSAPAALLILLPLEVPPGNILKMPGSSSVGCAQLLCAGVLRISPHSACFPFRQSFPFYQKRPIDLAKETYKLGLVALQGLLGVSFPFYQKRPIDLAKETYILGIAALEGLLKHFVFPFYPF